MLLGRCVFVATLAAGVALVASLASAQQQCNDSNQCTTDDMCSNGVCTGTPANGDSCDDGNPCTANDTCTPDGCAGTPMAGAACDDLNDCTINDQCMNLTPPPLPPTILCLGTPGSVDTECQGGCGTCKEPFPEAPILNCVPKPGVNAATQCQLPEFEQFPCIDGRCRVVQVDVFSTVTCIPSQRVCSDTDGNPCTDNCNFQTDQCEHDFPKCVPFCETCTPQTGACAPANLGVACNDGNLCTPQSRCAVEPFSGRSLCLAGEATVPTLTPTPILATPTATQTVVGVTATIPASTPTATLPPVTATSQPSTPTATSAPATATPSRTRPPVTPSPTLPPGLCVGDCNHDGHIRSNELILGVEIALAAIDLDRCPEFDANGDNMVIVDELVFAVNGSINGCGATASAP